jgi:hypothetical protein
MTVPAAICCLLGFFADEPPAKLRSAVVGMPARIDQLVLPGPELESRPPASAGEPIVLRVTGVFRHGTGHRYDLVYYGLEPGEFDLRDYLRRKDGGLPGELPAIPVTIVSTLPPGQIEPHPLEITALPRLGGYRLLLIAGSVLWVIGLLAILFVGRKRSSGGTASERPRSLADRLRPLVEQARAGQLPQAGLSELERLLLAYWRKRLGLQAERPAVAMAQLRAHPEASGLLRQLDEWLHQPERRTDVDVAALLAPYRDLPADSLDTDQRER